MAFIGDTKKIWLQLKLTNFAESLPESKTRFHVRRISFIVTILEDDDDVFDHKQPPSAEYQQVLNWQAEPEDLQDDIAVRNALTQLSGNLCPSKKISTSLYDKVKSDEDTQQMKIENLPLSAYRHLSFRSAMLTRHSGDDDGLADGQPELLFQHDGLGGEQSFLRWRSHDYIKVTLCKPRPYFRVFWLIQWDIVDLLQRIGSPNDAAVTIRGRRRPRSPSFHRLEAPMRRPDDYERFHGVRLHRKRKLPWIAEVRRKGNRKKIWLGNYITPEAAARAADTGNYYYDHSDKLNFRDSPEFLQPIPEELADESKEQDKKKFVVKQAHRLAELTEKVPSSLPSTWDPPNRTSYNGSGRTENSVQPATNPAIFEGLPDWAPLQNSVHVNLDARPSTSYAGEPSTSYGSSPEDLGLLWLRSTPNIASPVEIGSPQNSFFNDLIPAAWDANLAQDISNDITSRSPSELWAGEADVENFSSPPTPSIFQ